MAIEYTKRPATAAPVGAGGSEATSKVTLTKARPGISLTKQTGQLHVNLNWDARPAAAEPKGLFKRLAGQKPIDLDLGCLYELADGRKGVVQALGNAFGSLDAPPYILLDGDDRTGANTGGENLLVNLAHAAQIRRILLFAFIYDGAPSFDSANGVVTLSPGTGPVIEMRLDDPAGGSRMCAIALLTGGAAGFTVTREVNYIAGGQDALDQAYAWGMTWSAGRK